MEPDEVARGDALASADCVLIDGAEGDPLHLAAQVHTADSTIQTIVVAAPETIRALQRSLLFTPSVGEVWLVDDSRLSPPVVQEAVRVTRSRRRYLRQHASVTSWLTARTPNPRAKARLSDAYLAALLQALPDPVVALDDTGQVILWNPAAERIFGYSQAEALFRPLADLLGTASAVARLGRLLADGRSEGGRTELEFQRKDGRPGIAEATIATVALDVGRVHSVILTDITERRQLEEQLRQAQKMEAIGQLTGGIAHDFNNLLAVVLGNLELVRHTAPGAYREVAHFLEDAHSAARRGAEMIKKLLGFSRRDMLSLRPLDLNRVVGDAIETLRRLLPEPIRVEVEFAPRPAVVVADPGAVEQILLNLVTNARDAMPNGGRLRIALTHLERGAEADSDVPPSPDGYVRVRVRDTGTGMSPDTLAQAFEPFFTTKAVGQGTGLGLPMVYGLMKQHGGLIRLESELERGTTVDLFFPAATAPAPAPPPPEEGEPRRIEATILVVEDDHTVRRTMERVLEELGARVLAAADGQEALELYRRRRDEIRLVVSDVVMRRMGGRELCQALRAEGARIPVLLVSGYSADAQDLAEFGPGVSFLAKPWTIEQFSERICEMLEPAEGPERG